MTSADSRPTVEIRVRGPLGPTLRQAFPALTVRREDAETVLSGTICDQSALFGVLHRIEALGLELLELSCRSPEAPRGRPRDPSGAPVTPR